MYRTVMERFQEMDVMIMAAAVADFGLLLQMGSRDRERWDALERRVMQLEMPASFAADRGESFRELVAIARGMIR